MTTKPQLPPGITVFERGWLSANNILCVGESGTALVDSGYHIHSPQTLTLVEQSLKGRPLDKLLNTHLHSDHCGGNAALQLCYPALRTFIPPGHAQFVKDWDPLTLTYTPTGQFCPQFLFDDLLEPDTEVVLGSQKWQIHAAPGHDTHSILLYEPLFGTLISADSLWERGFGVVFPELEGFSAFDEVASTLDLIERLAPLTIIPGHGKVFTNVSDSLTIARRRLEGFVQSPERHALHAAKALMKFKLLEVQRANLSELLDWLNNADYLGTLHGNYFPDIPRPQWLEQLAKDLVRSGAAVFEHDYLVNV
jgi:glyoxylase-like metal-dependent hydrolase (beta-lactamase superfamily II)